VERPLFHLKEESLILKETERHLHCAVARTHTQKVA